MRSDWRRKTLMAVELGVEGFAVFLEIAVETDGEIGGVFRNGHGDPLLYMDFIPIFYDESCANARECTRIAR